jgi:hypothetical protein
MNKGDIFMAQTGAEINKCIRPVVIIDNEYVNILTTMNKRDFISCDINGKEHYIVPEKIKLSDVILYDYIKTINI